MGKGTVRWVVLACAFAASAALAPAAAGQSGDAQLPEAKPVRVNDPSKLDELLTREPAFRGRIVIPSSARWEMKNPCLPVRSGVQIVGERGPLGTRPVLHTGLDGANSVFEVQGDDVRIEGLDIQGAGSEDLKGHVGIVVGPKAEGRPGRCNAKDDPAALSKRVVIADNEIHGFNVGVEVSGNVQVDDPAMYPKDRTPLTFADVGLVRVERNYIHHNRPKGNGYGVVLAGDAFVTVEGNVFEFNVHSVAASGRANSGYLARFNYLLNTTYKYGCCYGHHFDVHGTHGSKHEGGPAGSRFEITSNTVRGDQDPSAFESPRAAFGLRGRPTQGALFAYNVLDHDRGDAVKLRAGDDKTLDDDRPSTFGLKREPNTYDAAYADEMATGDFDGDGRSDVFNANGTAWFYSRAGLRPWEFMRPSNKRLADLGFADIDNDGRTDVLYRDSSGKLSYVKSGTAAGLTPLASSPVPVAMRELRFGDFDGDGKADIFYTRAKQWRIWSGATHTWRNGATSDKAVGNLLFGEFDGVRGTDVVGINSRGWDYSSAGTQGWAPLNAKRSKSFDNAVAADVDGNSRSDIVFGGKGQSWRYSVDGRSALRPLRAGSGDVFQLRVGRFDGGPRQGIFSFGYPANRDRLGQWRSLGGGNGQISFSGQNMR
jgi:VCBS repeat protein